MSHPERLNIAVFIDFDNIEIGVRTTLNEHFDPGPLLDAIKERGEVVTKIAYADWTRAGEYSRALTQHAIRLVQRNLTPGGDKNGADINLALDALEMAFTHPHINAYVIVGGDSDFLSLVEKLKQYDKKVFVVGGRQFTSIILQRNCHEFIAYENLVRKPAARGGRPAPATASAPIAQAVPIVRRALKILADREVSPQTGLLKSTLLQLDSTFSERNYGASSFLDFVEKLAKAGLVQLKHSGRSVMVELNESFDESVAREATALPSPLPSPAPAPAPRRRPRLSTPRRLATPRWPRRRPRSRPPNRPPTACGWPDASWRPRRGARWPMYLRNVKQILRAAEGGFDERRYGFGGLMDLLRACQKESLVRLERDRRGGLRVFPGAALRGTAPQPAPFDGRPSAGPMEADAADNESSFQPYEAVEPESDESSVARAAPDRHDGGAARHAAAQAARRGRARVTAAPPRPPRAPARERPPPRRRRPRAARRAGRRRRPPRPRRQHRQLLKTTPTTPEERP